MFNNKKIKTKQENKNKLQIKKLLDAFNVIFSSFFFFFKKKPGKEN